MRILHLGKFFPPVCGGIENFVYDLTRAQARAGLKPSVLVHRSDLLKPTVRETERGYDVWRASIVGNLVYAPLSPAFPLVLRRILRSFRPDVLHVHLPNLSAFWLLAVSCRSPVVVHWHNDVAATQMDWKLARAYRFYRPFERRLLRRASAVIVTSYPYFQKSLPLQEVAAKCHIIPIGLDPTRLVRPPEGGGRSFGKDEKRPFFVLSAGRFTYYKGFHVLVEAVKELEDVRLVIAGDGPLRKNVVDRVNRLSLQDRVSIPGTLSNGDLHALMASCDVFCLPSIERTEGFGLVLLEAMTFSKPLISTDIEGSGVNWVNQHNETGLVVKAGDPEALAQAIRVLQRNPEMQREMGMKARERFEGFFHIRQVHEQIHSLYSTLQTPPLRGS